jgi:hypothetical protein
MNKCDFSVCGPSSVADPDPFLTDPNQDPAFQFDTDPDPAFQFDTDPDPAFQFDKDLDPDFNLVRIWIGTPLF